MFRVELIKFKAWLRKHFFRKPSIRYLGIDGLYHNLNNEDVSYMGAIIGMIAFVGLMMMEITSYGNPRQYLSDPYSIFVIFFSTTLFSFPCFIAAVRRLESRWIIIGFNILFFISLMGVEYGVVSILIGAVAASTFIVIASVFSLRYKAPVALLPDEIKKRALKTFAVTNILYPGNSQEEKIVLALKELRKHLDYDAGLRYTPAFEKAIRESLLPDNFKPNEVHSCYQGSDVASDIANYPVDDLINLSGCDFSGSGAVDNMVHQKNREESSVVAQEYGVSSNKFTQKNNIKSSAYPYSKKGVSADVLFEEQWSKLSLEEAWGRSVSGWMDVIDELCKKNGIKNKSRTKYKDLRNKAAVLSILKESGLDAYYQTFIRNGLSSPARISGTSMAVVKRVWKLKDLNDNAIRTVIGRAEDLNNMQKNRIGRED